LKDLIDAYVPKMFAGEWQGTMALTEPQAGSSLTGLALKGKIELFLADATLYLELFGIVAIAWQWLLQAVTAAKALGADPAGADADFYRGKIHTCRYFFAYELPKIRGLAARLKESGDGITVAMKPEYFE